MLSLLASSSPSISPASLTIDFPVWKDVSAAPHTAEAFSEAALAELHSQPREIP